MAKVHIVLVRATARNSVGESLPLADADPVAAKTVDTGAVSQDAGVVVPPVDATAQIPPIWNVTVSGGPVWIAFGAAPVAGPNGGWMLGDGETRSFGAKVGQRIALRNAN